MSDKPSYLSSLNGIVNGERRGFVSFDAWSNASPDADVSLMLKTVALREAEHAASFEKRMYELGYTLIEKEDPNFQKKLDLVCSDVSDVEKFESLGYAKTTNPDAEDQLLKLLEDKSIDPQTAGMLGRFIAEERDSGRILRAAYDCAKGKAAPQQDSATLNQLCSQLERLTESVAELQADRVKKGKVRVVKS